ncbi:MAG TPA: response regulator, partial [Eudoraea sp.]|nr:response regulator [Eudoraea sp.]
SFTNPEEALDDLRFNSDTQGPILVLLDVCMPEMTGFEFLEFMTLESLPLNIDVVIVTSSVSEEYRVLAGQYQQYVCDILTKPIRIQDLRAITDRKHTLEY